MNQKKKKLLFMLTIMLVPKILSGIAGKEEEEFSEGERESVRLKREQSLLLKFLECDIEPNIAQGLKAYLEFDFTKSKSKDLLIKKFKSKSKEKLEGKTEQKRANTIDQWNRKIQMELIQCSMGVPLVRQAANCNAGDWLIQSLRAERLDIFKFFLLDLDFDQNGFCMEDGKVICVLDAAAEKNNLDAIKLLFEKGVSVRLENALRIACKQNNPDIVAFLLSQGASPHGIESMENTNKKYLIEFAKESGYDEIYALLYKEYCERDLTLPIPRDIYTQGKNEGGEEKDFLVKTRQEKVDAPIEQEEIDSSIDSHTVEMNEQNLTIEPGETVIQQDQIEGLQQEQLKFNESPPEIISQKSSPDSQSLTQQSSHHWAQAFLIKGAVFGGIACGIYLVKCGYQRWKMRRTRLGEKFLCV